MLKKSSLFAIICGMFLGLASSVLALIPHLEIDPTLIALIIVLALSTTLFVAMLLDLRFTCVALLIFTPLFIKVPLLPVPGSITPIRADDFFFGLTILLWIAGALVTKRNPFRNNPLNFPILLFVFVGFTSTVLGIVKGTTSVYGGIFYFGRTVQYILIFYLFYSLFKIAKLKKYLLVILGTSMVVLFINLLQQLGILRTYYIEIVEGEKIMQLTRFSTFSASYDYGTYFVIIGLILYALLFNKNINNVKRKILILFFALIVGVIINSDDRTSVISFFVALGIGSIVLMRIKAWLILSVGILLLPFLARTAKIKKIITILSFKREESLVEAVLADPSFGVRIENWKLGLIHLKQNFFLGEGYSSFLNYMRQYNLPGPPDNWYIRVLIESGAIGLICFLYLIYKIIRIEFDLFKRTKNQLYKYFTLSTLLVTISLFITAIFKDIFVAIKIATYFWILTAMAIKIHYEEVVNYAKG